MILHTLMVSNLTKNGVKPHQEEVVYSSEMARNAKMAVAGTVVHMDIQNLLYMRNGLSNHIKSDNSDLNGDNATYNGLILNVMMVSPPPPPPIYASNFTI